MTTRGESFESVAIGSSTRRLKLRKSPDNRMTAWRFDARKEYWSWRISIGFAAGRIIGAGLEAGMGLMPGMELIFASVGVVRRSWLRGLGGVSRQGSTFWSIFSGLQLQLPPLCLSLHFTYMYLLGLNYDIVTHVQHHHNDDHPTSSASITYS
jgi:hypothetical protein